MVIKAWMVAETSYRHDDNQGTTETLFATEELMLIYFERIKTQYQNNETISIEEFDDGIEAVVKGGKWCYSVKYGIKEINIIENLD